MADRVLRSRSATANTCFPGARFGRWTVLGPSVRQRYVRVQCDCGKAKEVWSYSLLSGASQSCGCLSSEMVGQRSRTHGMSRGRHPLYGTWCAMWSRCNNPNNPSYPRYGGRGIMVCERWASFEAFCADMGERPPGLTLERVDNHKGYCPENCCWGTRKTQARNRRSNRIIETTPWGPVTVAEAAERSGLDAIVLGQRVRHARPIGRLFEPVRHQRKHQALFADTPLGRMPLKEAAKQSGVQYAARWKAHSAAWSVVSSGG
jgi:hypothetical protein